MKPQPIIEVRNIRKFRGDRKVLSDVSFSVSPGEFFSVLGPSGCGKTTLLRLISGLEQPDGGSIMVEGKPLSEHHPKDQKILLVFQNFALFPHMTVAQNVGFGLNLRGFKQTEISERVRYYLDLVKLGGFGDRFPAQLSGGQQQRVAIARALAPEPAAVLFDEPLGALDQKLRREMQFELKNLQERLRSTFIYVTHDQEEALTLSDRIALMNHGDLVQLGSASDLYKRPSNIFSAQFIGDNNTLRATVSDQLSDDTYIVRVGGAALTVSSAQSLQVSQDVFVFVRPENLNLAINPTKQISSDEFCVLDCESSQQLFVGRECLVNLNAEGQGMVAKVSSDQSYKHNKKMRCYWRKIDMHIFPANEKIHA